MGHINKPGCEFLCYQEEIAKSGPLGSQGCECGIINRYCCSYLHNTGQNPTHHNSFHHFKRQKVKES